MPQRTEFSRDQQQEMAQLYRDGATCQNIARTHGVDFNVAKRVLVGQGVYEAGRKFRGRYSEAQKAEMEARYIAGETCGAIAGHFKCDRLNVRYILLNRGVEIRTYRTYPLSEHDEKYIRRRRSDGANFATIARELNVPPHRALGWARQLGISDFKGKKGSDSPSWKGGVTTHHGYIYERVGDDDPHRAMARSNSYVPQHRLVMARALGRDLASKETVHHKNGDRTDNRIENLQLRQGNHGNGARFVCLDCGSHNVEAAAL